VTVLFAKCRFVDRQSLFLAQSIHKKGSNGGWVKGRMEETGECFGEKKKEKATLQSKYETLIKQ